MLSVLAKRPGLFLDGFGGGSLKVNLESKYRVDRARSLFISTSCSFSILWTALSLHTSSVKVGLSRGS
uniref:Uncharacterized protein n=1 Tax=Anguilla anguilla TaxID=7936 RepID=A0A0E9R6R7_ANGAN